MWGTNHQQSVEDTNAATCGDPSEKDPATDESNISTEQQLVAGNAGGKASGNMEGTAPLPATAMTSIATSGLGDAKNVAGEGRGVSGGDDPKELVPTNRTLRVFVSMNGTDDGWWPVEGPPVVYFEPVPEPDPEAESLEQAETKKFKAKRK